MCGVIYKIYFLSHTATGSDGYVCALVFIYYRSQDVENDGPSQARQSRSKHEKEERQHEEIHLVILLEIEVFHL